MDGDAHRLRMVPWPGPKPRPGALPGSNEPGSGRQHPRRRIVLAVLVEVTEAHEPGWADDELCRCPPWIVYQRAALGAPVVLKPHPDLAWVAPEHRRRLGKDALDSPLPDAIRPVGLMIGIGQDRTWQAVPGAVGGGPGGLTLRHNHRVEPGIQVVRDLGPQPFRPRKTAPAAEMT